MRVTINPNDLVWPTRTPDIPPPSTSRFTHPHMPFCEMADIPDPCRGFGDYFPADEPPLGPWLWLYAPLVSLTTKSESISSRVRLAVSE